MRLSSLSDKERKAFDKQKQYAKEHVCYDSKGNSFVAKTICFNGEFFVVDN